MRGLCCAYGLRAAIAYAAAPLVIASRDMQKIFATTPYGVEYFPPTGLRPAPKGAIERPLWIGRSGIASDTLNILF